AVPGKYQVRLSAGAWSQTQPLTVSEDPRITADGVTTADLQEQFDHNMRVRAAQRNPPAGADPAKIAALADKLITSPIRYSQPKLETQITYLYSMTNSADQKIGRDAIARYAVLKKQLAALAAEANSVLGAGN